MDSDDFLTLAVLGAAARQPTDLDGLCAAIAEIATGPWSPVAQLIADRVEALIGSGHLWARTSDGRPRVVTTARGRKRLAELLARPLPPPAAPLGQAGLGLKLAFLDLATPAQRRCQLDGMICAYESELAERERRCADCPARRQTHGRFGLRWLDRDTERLRHDLALLRDMAAPEALAPFAGAAP